MTNLNSINSELQKAWLSRYTDTKSALIKANNYISNENNITKYFAKLIIAYCKFIKTDYKGLFKEVKEINEFFSNEKQHKGNVISNYLLAGIYDQFGYYEKALKHADYAVKQANNQNDDYEIANASVALGLIYNRLKDYELALELFSNAYLIRTKTEDYFAAASTLNLIARSYSLKKDRKQAEEYYMKSLDLREKINDKNGIPWTFMGLASLYEEFNQYQKAIENYKKALSLDESNKQCSLLSYHGLGRVYRQLKDYDNSYLNLQKAISIAELYNSKPLMFPIYSSLSKYYENIGDYKLSLDYYKKYHDLKNEVLNIETINRINNLKIEYNIEQAKRESEIFKLRNVELKNANEEIRNKNRDLLDSIKYAYRIQTAISPPQYVVDELMPKSFILYKPKDVVSGDFYFISKFHDKILFAAVDCTGHGVPGALMSVIGYNWLVQGVRREDIRTPGQLLSYLDEGVNETLRQTADESGVKDSMDLAVCSIDPKTNTVMYAGAYNPCYYVHKGELQEIKADKLPIGVNEDGVVDIYTDHTIKLDKGDNVYIFSDGYADQFGGPKGKKFKYRQLKEKIMSVQDKKMKEQNAFLEKTLVKWQGEEEQVDDILLIGVCVDY